MSRFGKNNGDDFEVNKSEIFNSDYYFDDIIEELSESGLYSENEIVSKSSEEQIDDSEKITIKMDGMKQDINQRIQKIEQRVLNINEMLFNTKSELVQTMQKMQNNLLLMKFETEEGINKLGDLFKEKISNDSVKEKSFEELYSQLEAYKRNFVFSAMKPFIHDLLLFYDRINTEIDHAAFSGSGECTKLFSFRSKLFCIF
ncbi:MAG: hypothetical protein KKD38_09880, partial [Candidatus Delongbacteria bacterium]|nr:hypothetical protein [Candidatus Delongbacteria bacterium]MCG2760441.1 hypothetical protein [Candidatus Delongbacteria bacterium]